MNAISSQLSPVGEDDDPKSSRSDNSGKGNGGSTSASITNPITTITTSPVTATTTLITSIHAGPTYTSDYEVSSTQTSSNLAQGSNDGGNDNNGSSGDSGSSNDSTLVIILATVLSVVGLLLIAGAVFLCIRYRRKVKRASLFKRGITPINDDEIATWRMSHEEKGPAGTGQAAVAAGIPAGQKKHDSTNSTRKPAGVIVYSNAVRRSEERSPRSVHGYNAGKKSFDGYGGRTSLDKELPQAPIQARAPNAREGLTDETVPGDDPFIQTPRRQHSRLSKMSPVQQPRNAHARTRSARSSFSMRSLGEPLTYNSDVERTPRTSLENHHHPQGRSHTRVFSSNSIPPRLSLSDDWPSGGLSPRPLIRKEDIGRAIG